MLPVAGAKWKHTFVASTATLPMQIIANELEISEDEKEESPGENAAAGSSKEVGNHMDVDRAVPLESLSSSSKRKHSHIDNDSITFPFSGASSDTTAPGTSIASVDKKPSSLPKKSKQSAKSSSKLSSSSKAADKISNAAALHGMQGSINRITDMFEKSVAMPLDPHAAGRNEALHLLQTRDDGLTLAQQTQMLTIFMENHIAAEMYVALVNEDLRKSWLQSMLG
jgi:hypothetical protein